MEGDKREDENSIMMRGEEEQYVLHSEFTHGRFAPESQKGDVKWSILKINIS